MKTYRLLSTAALAVLFAAGAASAQNMKKDESPAAAPPAAAQQKAPAEKIAPPMNSGQNKAGVKPTETTGQAPKASDSNQPRASDKGAKEKSLKPAETTGQAPKSQDADSPRASDKGSAGKSMEKEPAAKSPPAKSGGADMKGKANGSTTQAPLQPASPKSSQSTTTEKSTTTGQGAASGSAKLSTEQRTKITTVIKQQNVQRVEPSKLNISIRVGARVPTSVRFYALPVEVIAIYPEWRGYDYILVGDEILVINPRTHEIVANSQA